MLFSDLGKPLYITSLYINCPVIPVMSKRTINKVVRSYNRDRAPEVEARLIGTKRNSIIMRFSGESCLTCGYRDFFSDFMQELQRETGSPVRLKKVDEKNLGIATAIFSVIPVVG